MRIIGDGKDNDCNGLIDDNAVNESTWYYDEDGDSYGNDENYVGSCTQPDGFVAVGGDCDDSNPLINPGALEICGDGIDQDCNNIVDDGTPGLDDIWYIDKDGDNWGYYYVDMDEPIIYSCSQPEGYGKGGDCNDSNASIYPGADEICGDGIDQDCDGSDLECDPLDTDDDGDGYTENDGDCDDGDDTIYPGATEICEDGIDQDCDGDDTMCLPM